jgi:hypothetical protein
MCNGRERQPAFARQRFKLRHHAISAMPIPARDKRNLYKMLSFERKGAERRLRATIKGCRTMRVETHPGSWKQFLAARAVQGDQRSIRRLTRQPPIGRRSPRSLPWPAHPKK